MRYSREAGAVPQARRVDVYALSLMRTRIPGRLDRNASETEEASLSLRSGSCGLATVSLMRGLTRCHPP